MCGIFQISPPVRRDWLFPASGCPSHLWKLSRIIIAHPEKNQDGNYNNDDARNNDNDSISIEWALNLVSWITRSSEQQTDQLW